MSTTRSDSLPDTVTPAADLETLDPTAPLDPVNVGEYGFEGRFEDWTQDARYFEYTKAADPVGLGYTPKVPAQQFGPELYAGGPTRIVPLDLSEPLGITSGPVTSPGLIASFVRIRAGERIHTEVNASSQLYYVISGRGFAVLGGSLITWSKGDFITLPADRPATFHAEDDAAMYWVHDEPLLRYLGVEARTPRFRPTVFPRARAVQELTKIAEDPGANAKNRVSVLLANAEEEQTLTITHTLWAMFGLLPEDQVQKPHRHQSVALDLILDCAPGCYTLLGDELDEQGEVKNPTRVEWQPGGAFVTPPGKWHSHHNESGREAHLIPVQDAGLQTYLRSHDIRFRRFGNHS